MSVLQWMDVIYLVDVVLCVVFILSKICYRLIVRARVAVISRRVVWWIQRVIEVEIAGWAIECYILYLLAIMTGENPRLSIDEYRYLVAWARAVLGVMLLVGITINVMTIWLFVSNSRSLEYE